MTEMPSYMKQILGVDIKAVSFSIAELLAQDDNPPNG